MYVLSEMQANYHHIADERLIMTEGNGEFTKKEAFVLSMEKEKDLDRRVEIDRNKKWEKG